MFERFVADFLEWLPCSPAPRPVQRARMPFREVVVHPGHDFDIDGLVHRSAWHEVGIVRIIITSAAVLLQDPDAGTYFFSADREHILKRRLRKHEPAPEPPENRSRRFAQRVAAVLARAKHASTITLHIENFGSSSKIDPNRGWEAMFDALRNAHDWRRAAFSGHVHEFGGFFLACGAERLEEIVIEAEVEPSLRAGKVDVSPWRRTNWPAFPRLKSIVFNHGAFATGINSFISLGNYATLPRLETLVVEFDGGHGRSDSALARDVHTRFLHELSICGASNILLELRNLPPPAGMIQQPNLNRLCRELRLAYDAYPHALEHLARTALRIERLVLLPCILDHGVITSTLRNVLPSPIGNMPIIWEGSRELVIVEPSNQPRVFEQPLITAALAYLQIDCERCGIRLRLPRSYEAPNWDVGVFMWRPNIVQSERDTARGNPGEDPYAMLGAWQGTSQMQGEGVLWGPMRW